MPGFLRFLDWGLIDAQSRTDVDFLPEHTERADDKKLSRDDALSFLHNLDKGGLTP